MTLLDVDAEPLRGRTIRSATLHLKKAGDEPLKRVTVSSVGAEWFEGTGSSYAVQPGGATFRQRRHPDLPWSIGGGDLCHVVLGNGGTTWRMADASPPDQDGWQHVPVDPEVVAARVAGLSHGFLVFDDTGSEWTRSGETFTLPALPQSVRLQPGAESVERPVFHASSSGPTIAGRRKPRATCAVEPETAHSAGRRGAGLVGHARATQARPARSGSSRRSTATRCHAS